MHQLIVRQLGRTPYSDGLDLQIALRDRVIADPSREYLILVEHPPVITLGRRADPKNILLNRDELRRRGFEIHDISRGGDVTYHGPGQLVGYPIISLNAHHLGIRSYIRALEEVLIRALARFKIAACRIDGITGVWVGSEKIAAIGVAIHKFVSYHGFALNINTDLSHFAVINPCGITDKGVTSMAVVVGRRVDEWEVRRAVEEEFRAVFGFGAMSDASRGKFPPWLNKRFGESAEVDGVRTLLSGLSLHTVCESARCPNLRECFGRRTATFMILGDVCTRTCRFCAVEKGTPAPVDVEEPERVATAAEKLKLRHVVVTSVTRDDLADGGASQFARTVEEIARRASSTVEVLTPDFKGDERAIRVVADAGPDVYNHNLETVPSLYETVRPGADYERSLRLLKLVNGHGGCRFTKSGVMLGLGESIDEVLGVMRDLRGAGCDLLTLGQYLAPSKEHLPVARFVHPDEFEELAAKAREMGFSGVSSGPFVRSSHMAGELFEGAKERA